MTLSPTESRNVVGLKGDAYPDYRVGPLCCAPGCSRLCDHAHHLWRRSQLGGPFSWVRLEDGTILGNLVPLCYDCHRKITDNEAHILWVRESFQWSDRASAWKDRDWDWPCLIDPQPPIHGKPEQPDMSTPSLGPAAVETCPTCKRTMPHEHSEKKSKAKRRKTWTVTVPAEADEDGALVLDTLLDECRKIFKHDDAKNVRYFSLTQALALVVEHGHRMMRDD